MVNHQSYLLTTQLGKGGNSVVYLAESKAKKKYALKRMTVPGRKERERAMREVEILRKFSHPNIVKMYDFQVVPSTVISNYEDVLILMEFFQNGTFQDLINKQQSPIPEATLLKIFSGTCLAVKQLHDAGISHRDLKPANILLGQSFHPVLTDFGSAGDAVLSSAQIKKNARTTSRGCQ